MKKERKKLSLSKFRVAQIKRPDYIRGGNGDDDGTVGDSDKDKCELKSAIIKKK